MNTATVVATSEGRRIRFNRARALWAPIVLLEVYLAFTVLVFFYGPVDWDVPNVPKLIGFLLVNYAGLWLGYRWGISSGRAALMQSPADSVGHVRMPPQLARLLTISMVFCIASTLVRLYAIRGSLGVVLSTFLSPGEAYRESQLIAQMDRNGELMTIAQFSWAFRISTLLSVLNSIYFPLALACWERLTKLQKFVFFAALLCTVMFTVGLGAQSGIGFLLFSSLPVALYKLYVSGRSLTSMSRRQAGPAVRTVRNRAWVKAVVVVLTTALVMTVILFQIDRREATGLDLDAADALAGPFASPSEHFPVMSGRLGYGLAMMCLYASHGYEGLALSMELPFEWTYGLGWSKALQVIYSDYLGGTDPFERSYLARNEIRNTWPALTWWSTIFPWIASDTTFYGTVLVMVLVGFVIGHTWTNVIITGNPIGFALLAQMFTLVFMFPANNALAQTLDGLFALIGLLIIYGLSRKYFVGAQSPVRPRAPFPERVLVG